MTSTPDVNASEIEDLQRRVGKLENVLELMQASLQEITSTLVEIKVTLRLQKQCSAPDKCLELAESMTRLAVEVRRHKEWQKFVMGACAAVTTLGGSPRDLIDALV